MARRYKIWMGQLWVWDDSPLDEFGQVWIPICPECRNGPVVTGLVCGECEAVEG